MVDRQRYDRAIADFDAANAEDPQVVIDGAVERPRALVMAERLSSVVAELDPEASEALRLATRCQHLRRWTRARADYPAGRVGYLKWRKDLSRFHAAEAEKILRDAGYEDDVVAAVRRLNLKRDLRRDPDMQTLEDGLCLVFLTYQLDDFATRHPDDKVVSVLAKTWVKMSAQGRQSALALPLNPRLLELVERAVALALG